MMAEIRSLYKTNTELVTTVLLATGLNVKLIKRRDVDRALVPQIRGEESVGIAKSSEGGLQRILSSTGAANRRGVAILDTSKLEKLLDSRGCNDILTTRSRDETDSDAATFSSSLRGNGVGETDHRTPVATANGDQVELSNADSSANSSCNLLGSLDTKTDVTVTITNDDNSTEAVALTGTSLLLNRLDLHDLIFKIRDKLVDDLSLLDWKRVGIDLLEGVDLASLHETAKLGDGFPSLLFTASTSGTTTSGATTATAAAESTLCLLRGCRCAHINNVVLEGDFVGLISGYWQVKFFMSPTL